MNSILALNQAQERSVRHIEGNSLVIAGAGSGKTRTLIAKIIYLIQNQKVAPHQILAITFTNKAAREMRDRVAQIAAPSHLKHTPDLLGKGSQGLQIRTFHSFGVMFLRRFLHEFSAQQGWGYRKNFTLIDPEDQKKILKQLYPDSSPADFPFRRYLYLISAWKNDFLYPGDDSFEEKVREYYEEYGFPEDPKNLYYRYMEFLQAQNLLDFDDLIGFTVKILQSYSPAIRYAAERWRHVLVDEYQDTNCAQEKIVEFFIRHGGAVTVVGDDQQSIYGFRGARMDNILSFKKKYSPVEIFILEENYRSTQPILNLANHVISKNPEVYPKKLFTHIASGELPSYIRFSNDLEESKWIIKTITHLQTLQTEDTPKNEIAIFYRTNYQSRILEDLLIRSQLPYQIVKGQKFYERKEIKDVLAYLQWFINPHDQISFERMVNTPPRRLGEKTLEKIFLYLKEKNLPLSEIFRDPHIPSLIPKPALEGWSTLQILFQELDTRYKTGTSLSEWLNFLIQKSGLQKFYESEKDDMTRDQRLGNLDALFEALDTYIRETEGGIEDFLLSLSLGEEKEEEEKGKIKLMTVHNAKGLEFDVVFVVGMEDEVFPHSLTLDNEQEIEEERRLFYVAITRARKRLYLSSAALKYRYQSQVNFNESRFITEIENSYLTKEVVGLDGIKNSTTSFFSTESSSDSEEHEFY